MKLYEMTNEIKGLYQLVESGELTQAEIKDTLDAVEGSFKDKVESALKLRQQLIRDAEGLDVEATRITALQVKCENSAESIKAYIKQNMEALELDKLSLDLFKVTLKKSTKKLGALDEDKIPKGYFETIPASKKLDKRKLLKDAKEEDIAGVELIDSSRALTIK